MTGSVQWMLSGTLNGIGTFVAGTGSGYVGYLKSVWGTAAPTAPQFNSAEITAINDVATGNGALSGVPVFEVRIPTASSISFFTRVRVWTVGRASLVRDFLAASAGYYSSGTWQWSASGVLVNTATYEFELN